MSDPLSGPALLLEAAAQSDLFVSHLVHKYTANPKALFEALEGLSQRPSESAINASALWLNLILVENRLVDYVFVGDCAMYLRGFPIRPRKIEIQRNLAPLEPFKQFLDYHGGIFIPQHQPCANRLHVFVNPARSSIDNDRAKLPTTVFVHAIISMEDDLRFGGVTNSGKTETIIPANNEGVAPQYWLRRLPVLTIQTLFQCLLTAHASGREHPNKPLSHMVWVLCHYRRELTMGLNVFLLSQVRDDLRRRGSSELADLVEQIIGKQPKPKVTRKSNKRLASPQVQGPPSVAKGRGRPPLRELRQAKPQACD